GGSSERVLPTPDELRQLLHQPRTSLVLNLSAMTRAEKVAYATKALGAVSFVRSTTGLPHWLILDEAHHIAPADGSPVVELLRAGTESLCMSTLQVTDLAPELRTLPNVVAATELDAFAAATRAAATGRPPVLAAPNLAAGGRAPAWPRQQVKDEDLAGALAAVETADLPPAESRRRALDEIRARYTV